MTTKELNDYRERKQAETEKSNTTIIVLSVVLTMAAILLPLVSYMLKVKQIF